MMEKKEKLMINQKNALLKYGEYLSADMTAKIVDGSLAKKDSGTLLIDAIGEGKQAKDWAEDKTVNKVMKKIKYFFGPEDDRSDSFNPNNSQYDADEQNHWNQTDQHR